jgi:hypothetical protein
MVSIDQRRWRDQRPWRDQRGVALPMALLSLALLTTLMLALAAMSKTEPLIAGNQLRVSQARAQAESGAEHAIWALSAGNVRPGVALPAGTLANPLPSSPAAAPFDGSFFFTMMGNIGGYTVHVTTPDPVNRPMDRDILAVGWTPTNVPTNTHRRIMMTVKGLPDLSRNAPCVLCVRGDVAVSGASLIDASTDTVANCGGTPKFGAFTAGALDRAGSANIKAQVPSGPSGNVVGVDYVTGQSPAEFDKFDFDNGDLNTLKALAKKNGTYFGPGYPNGTPASSPTYTGSTEFNSSNKVKSGIVFIDTTTGHNIVTCNASSPPGCVSTPESQFGNVSINGNPFLDPAFTGMLVVNGRIAISGNMRITGLVYAMDDLVYNGTGTGEISGLVISQNVRNTSATAITDTDSTTFGNSRIKLNCDAARAAGQAPQTFALVPGSYREVPD